MLRHKDTVILSEIKGFFAASEKAIVTILSFMSFLIFPNKQFRFPEAANLHYNKCSKFVLLLLFPFIDIQDSSHYCESALFKYISCGKDIFYRFINNSMIDWCKFVYSLNMQLIRKVEKQTTAVRKSFRFMPMASVKRRVVGTGFGEVSKLRRVRRKVPVFHIEVEY